MKKLLILMLLGVLFVPMNGSAKADEVFYCQSEAATGLFEENGIRKSSTFQLKRYTIKFSSDYTIMKGLRDDYFCLNKPKSTIRNRHICRHLSDIGNTFIFDSQSKRFVFSTANFFTYFDTATPTIEAGTCEKF